MVCMRCITVLNNAFTKAGIKVAEISLGKVVIEGEMSQHLESIQQIVSGYGFELFNTRQVATVEKIKQEIDRLLETDKDERGKFSTELSQSLGISYDVLSSLFSAHEGVTIEQYVIAERLYKVQQLLVKTDSSLTDIADITGYSSVHHLSRQFKDTLGITASEYRLNHKII